MQVALPAAAVVLLAKRWRDTLERRSRLTEAMLEYNKLFDVPTDRLHAIRDALVEQMQAGLRGEPGGLMMLPSFVDVLPSGEERGHCYAIDLGGTNLRVAHVELGEQRGATAATHIREWPIPEELFDTDNAGLLPFVACCTAEVVREFSAADGDAVATVGFCFSFPVEQEALDHGKLLGWTKNFRGTHLVGQDVVGALWAALAAEGVAARVPAVLNDTVATLVALRYSQPDTEMGVILGTGTNCAYCEPISADLSAKLPLGYRGRGDRMVVNTEWADFRSPHLPTSVEDVWVDCSSAHPGVALFEKQLSGLYLGEVARRILLRLAEKEQLFGSATPPPGLCRHFRLSTAHMAAMDEDSSAELAGVARVLHEALGIAGTSKRQRQKVQEVCRLVCLRSARLCAAAVAGALRRMGHRGGGGDEATTTLQHVVVAMDGSVYAKYGKYRERLRQALVDVCGAEAAACVELQLVQDGSVLGAAFLAMASK